MGLNDLSPPWPSSLAPRPHFTTCQTLWKSRYQTFIGLNVSKKENTQCLHLPGCLTAACVSHCQRYAAAKMPPVEDFNLLAAHQEGVHPTHAQQKQSWLLLIFFFFPPCTPASKTGVCIPHHAYLCKVIPTPAPHFLAISKLQTPKCRSILSSGNDYKMLSPFLLQIDRALAHLDSFSKMPQHSHSSKQTLVCPTGTCIAVTHWPFQKGKTSHSAAG